MTGRTFIARLRTTAALLLVGALVACSTSDDPMDPGDELVVSGVIIQENDVAIASALGSEVLGRLGVSEGQTGALWDVVFVDAEGLEFETFADEIMEVEVADESIAEFQQEGTFSGRLVGVAAGETSATFSFVQGGVVTYTSPPIPIDVLGPSE